MHNVVYEYLPKVGGYAGCRYWVSYHSKEEASEHADDVTKAIAEGIPEQEAMNLTSLTPEVCRLTSAVSESCYKEDGTIDPTIFSHQLFMACYAIEFDRNYIEEHDLTQPTTFVKCEVGPEDTEKNRLLKVILATCLDPRGNVDLDFMNLVLNMEVMNILEERIMKGLVDIVEILVDDQNPLDPEEED